MAEKLRKTRQGHKLCVTNLIKTSRELIEQIKEDQDEAKLVKLESKRNTLIKQTEEVKHLKGQLQRFHKLSLFDRFRHVENGFDINF